MCSVGLVWIFWAEWALLVSVWLFAEMGAGAGVLQIPAGLPGLRRGEHRAAHGAWVHRELLQGQVEELAALSHTCLMMADGPRCYPHLCHHRSPQDLLFFQNQEIEELTKICDELIAKLGKSD